jgi:histidyl-tRNA synthetase
MQKFQPVRGTKDLLPEKFAIYKHITQAAEKLGSLYGYKSISTPIIEHSGVFDRTLGECSDVISKEMYKFLDRGGDYLCLRPEFTAGIMRCFIHHGELRHNLPLKFLSYGPLFRYDRPQAGRQRQFHQVNFEYIGGNGALADAETIKLCSDFFRELEIQDTVTLHLNSLGCTESRASYTKGLVEYFQDNRVCKQPKLKLRVVQRVFVLLIILLNFF